MSKVIIHISDLHVTNNQNIDGTRNLNVNSFLTTSEDESSANYFIDEFVSCVTREYPQSSFILLLTGDVSNTGATGEFKYAEKFINRIKSALKISKENCIILPGDHDVHRRSLENELDDTPNQNSHLLNETKFRNFASFYKAIREENFPFNEIVVSVLEVSKSIILIGLNSNQNIGVSGGFGFIDVEKFKTEFEKVKGQYAEQNKQYVLAWHHNLTASYENKNAGQWDIENRRHFLAELDRQNIKLILTGNEHTSSSKKVGQVYTSDAGTLTSIRSDAAFKVYPITDDEESIVLKNEVFGLVKTEGNDKKYFWSKRDPLSSSQEPTFALFEKNNQFIGDVVELPSDNNSQELKETVEIAAVRTYYDNPEIAERLYTIVKEKQLFHSGHFHWSPTSRAHNWIDVSKLLENNDDLYFAQNAIIDIMSKFSLMTDCHLIIGLGYEGNILSSKASIKYDIPYASLPYSYRYEDHHHYEKQLNFNNSTKSFKNVIIITDVVNNGSTIKDMIKAEANFFVNVDNITVLSLFYTGDQQINVDILNDFILKDERETQSITIDFYTVKSLRVEKCPYGDQYKEDCFIYRDELNCVHLFYDDNNG